MTVPAPTDQSTYAFARLAERYCALIDDRASYGRAHLLTEMQRQLPTLYAAALRLPDVWAPEPESPDDQAIAESLSDEEQFDPTKPVADPDGIAHTTWKSLHGDIAQILGEHQYYSRVYSPSNVADHDPVIGDLADDFADIYRDLLRGLAKFRRGDLTEAAWEWQFHFAAHWGQHAADGIRVIHNLAYGLGITSAF